MIQNFEALLNACQSKMILLKKNKDGNTALDLAILHGNENAESSLRNRLQKYHSQYLIFKSFKDNEIPKEKIDEALYNHLQSISSTCIRAQKPICENKFEKLKNGTLWSEVLNS